jgi:hypothetical protein
MPFPCRSGKARGQRIMSITATKTALLQNKAAVVVPGIVSKNVHAVTDRATTAIQSIAVSHRDDVVAMCEDWLENSRSRFAICASFTKGRSARQSAWSGTPCRLPLLDSVQSNGDPMPFRATKQISCYVCLFSRFRARKALMMAHDVAPLMALAG